MVLDRENHVCGVNRLNAHELTFLQLFATIILFLILLLQVEDHHISIVGQLESKYQTLGKCAK